MTLNFGQQVRITNRGPFDGHAGTIISTNGHIVGVKVGDGPIVPLYVTEVQPSGARTPR
jgi:hypothetical protein